MSDLEEKRVYYRVTIQHEKGAKGSISTDCDTLLAVAEWLLKWPGAEEITITKGGATP